MISTTPGQPRERGAIAALLAGTALAMLLAAAIYLLRASGPLSSNWPISYNLTSSDNGVLYQLAHDLFTGMSLDWSFSPQTYTFPEIPLSLAAYLIAAGNLYWYYLVIAALNTGLLVLTLGALVRYLYPAERPAAQLLRTAIASAPLLLLPLLAHNVLFLFAIAPTYYFGIYLMALALPIALLTPRRWLRVLVLAAYLLTGASDPLLFAMTLPGVLLVALLARRRSGCWRLTRRILGTVAAVLAIAALLRFTVLAPMVAADPVSYISAAKALAREQAILHAFSGGFLAGVDLPLLLVSVAALAACLFLFWRSVRPSLRRAPALDVARGPERTLEQTLTISYLSSLPFLGALLMFAILAVHFYYLWLLVVGSMMIAALLVPRPRALRPLAVGLAGFAVLAASVLGARALLATYRPQYFGYQAPVTECLDANVPANALGYATFSDARRYGLTSTIGLRLLPINADLEPNYWLTNRAPQLQPGSFVLLGPNAAEPALSPQLLTEQFGTPERTVSCPSGYQIWFYQSAAAQQRISAYLAQWAWLR